MLYDYIKWFSYVKYILLERKNSDALNNISEVSCDTVLRWVTFLDRYSDDFTELPDFPPMHLFLNSPNPTERRGY